jgi:hypothetical protein
MADGYEKVPTWEGGVQNSKKSADVNYGRPLVQNTGKRTRSMSEIANSTLHKGCQRPIMMKRVHLRTYHSLYYRLGTMGTKKNIRLHLNCYFFTIRFNKIFSEVLIIVIK